jgi:hypothetical protein
MLTRFILFLFLSGCGYYQEISLQNQTDYDHAIDKKDLIYFLQTPMTAPGLYYLINEDLKSPQYDGCAIDLFMIDWLLKEKFLTSANKKIEQFTQRPRCKKLEKLSLLKKAEFFLEKNHAQEVIDLLPSIFSDLHDPAYKDAVSLLAILLEKNPDLFEVDPSLKRMKDFFHILQSESTDDNLNKGLEHPFFYHVKKERYASASNKKTIEGIILLYDNKLNDSFVAGMMKSFEDSHLLSFIQFFDIKKDNDLILNQLKQRPNTLLIGYRLNQSVPKILIDAATYSIMIESPSVDLSEDHYAMDFSLKADLSLIGQQSSSAYPQLVIYDKAYEPYINQKELEKIPKVFIDQKNFQVQLNTILQLYDKKYFFKDLFHEDVYYIQQPKMLPFQVLLLLEPSLARLVYPYLLYWGQEQTGFIATNEILSGEQQLDKTLSGLWILTNPSSSKVNQPYEYFVGIDVISIINRIRWFSVDDSYVYHGLLGRYSLDGQTIKKDLKITKYKTR